MDVLKVINRLEELRGTNTLSSSNKTEIESLYSIVLGKTFIKTSCSDCYKDACIEAILYLRKNGKMKEKSNYSLKNGVVLQPEFGGAMYTNANLTDEVAESYLGLFPNNVNYFATLPTDYKNRVEKRLHPDVLNDELISTLCEALKDETSDKAIYEAFAEYQIDDKVITKKVLTEHLKAAKKLVKAASENEKVE